MKLNIDKLLGICYEDFNYKDGILRFSSKDMEFVVYMAIKFQGSLMCKNGYTECVFPKKTSKEIWNKLISI